MKAPTSNTMSTDTDLDTDPTTGTDAPDAWPPLAHIFAGPFPVKPGDKALCGVKLMGIDLRGTDCKTCGKCVEIARGMGGL